jgi:manganese efflux pump family protein
VYFSLAHVLLLLAGYNLGHILGHFIDHIGTHHNPFSRAMMQNWAETLGAVVLVLLGINMIWENIKGNEEEAYPHPVNPLQGLNLILLAVSVSLDALAVGFGLGMLDIDLFLVSVVLGAIIFVIAVAGLLLGRRLGIIIGHRAELVGGIILVLMGINVML